MTTSREHHARAISCEGPGTSQRASAPAGIHDLAEARARARRGGRRLTPHRGYAFDAHVRGRMDQDFIGPADAPDRFVLARRLGGGSMGVVYEAYDRTTGRRNALKTLAQDDPRFLTNLKREFRLVQSVLHPNLVRLHGLFQGTSTWFFTMELVEGTSYLTWLRDDGAGSAPTEPATGSTTAPLSRSVISIPTPPATPTVIARLLQTLPQLGSALVALHSEGLVHRDVKPSNLLLTADGRLVLIDFGLARVATDEAHGCTFAGTPAYMAPEQASGGPVTAATDCYAAGVILYQALTGRLPFVGALEDLIQQKRTWAPVAPSLLAPGVPVELEALCLRLLAHDPATRPTAAEIAAWRQGARRPRPLGASRSTSAIFVGRALELEQVRTAFAAGASARPPVVLVDGESGIGKTALLSETNRRFASERALVLRGRCFEHEVSAYAGVDMIMDALVGQLRRLDERAGYFAPRHLAALRQIFPAIGTIPAFGEPDGRSSAGHHEMRLRAASAFQELFARVATRYQVVIALDDAQWLTEASLVLLSSLLAGDDPVPIMLLLAARGSDLGLVGPWLDTLTCKVTRVSLGPLSQAESLELLRHHLAGRSEAELETMAHDSAGHPYLLRELALATGERATSGQPRVDDVLRARAAQLAPLERAILDLVCVATAPICPQAVGDAAGIGVGELAAITASLVRQRWVVVTPRDHDGSIWPAHDRVRAVLRGTLDGPTRQELARRLADALESSACADVEALALQWSEAGDLPRAARFARLAGDRAMEKLAFEHATDLYELALRGTSCGVERAAILTAMADAFSAAGRGAEAAASYLRAAGNLAGPPADDLVLRAADQLIRSGQVAEGKQLLGRVLDRLDIRLPGSPMEASRMVLLRRLALRLRGLTPRSLSDEQRRELVRRVDACWVVGDLFVGLDPLRATALHLHGLSLALDAGDPYRLARSLCTHATLAAQPGRSSRGTAFARLALAERMCTRVGSPQLDGYLALANGVIRVQMGEFDEAQPHLDRAESTFERCPGAYWELGHAREFALWALAYRGRLPELSRRLTSAVSLSTARGDRVGAFKLLVGPSRLALLSRDEPYQLLEACRMELIGLSPNEYSLLALCALFSRVNAFLYLGRAADALATLDEARWEIRSGHMMHCQLHRIELAYLRGCAALARASECPPAKHAPLVTMTRRCVRALRRERVAWANALATTLEASLALITATRERSIIGLQEGAKQLEASGLGSFASAVRWQLQHVLGCEADLGELWQGATIVRPERLAHTLAPLPTY